MPVELPSPLKIVVIHEFPTLRKQVITGCEATEEQERDEARQHQWGGIKAQDEQDENGSCANKMAAGSQHEILPSVLTQLFKAPSTEISSISSCVVEPIENMN